VDGILLGVFGSDPTQKASFEAAVAKKSEAEGIAVFHRSDGARKASLLDTADFPQRIQGYSRIASISDHALYFFPPSGSLSAPDGELAVLIGAFSLGGTLEIPSGSTDSAARSALRGTPVADFPAEERQQGSSILDLSRVAPRPDFTSSGTLIYVDRAFSVKGVGTVALGFVLSGKVSVHDRLRPIPGPVGLTAEVRGVQVNDVDHQEAGRGIRVGLLLKGVEPKDIERSNWLDDGTFPLRESASFGFSKSPFYRAEVDGRDLHLQLPGGLIPVKVSESGGELKAVFPSPVPLWTGMRACVMDLNGKNLRVAGGCACKL